MERVQLVDKNSMEAASLSTVYVHVMENFLDHFCRSCHHLTRQVRGGKCIWCESTDIGLVSNNYVLHPFKRATGKQFNEEPDTVRKSLYPLHYRLARGFSIINGGDI